LTFLLVIVALTWFHAASVAAGGDIVAGMIGRHGLALPETTAGVPVLGWLGIRFVAETDDLGTLYGWIAVLLAIALVPPNILEILRVWQPAVTMPGVTPSGRLDLWRGLSGRLTFTLSPVWAFACAAVLAVGVMGLNRVSEFLYWRF
jgi:hypothetical protein